MRDDDFFLLNTETLWGLFLVSAQYYPEEFYENLSHVSYIGSDENVNSVLIRTIGRNELKRKNFNVWRDVGKIFYR